MRQLEMFPIALLAFFACCGAPVAAFRLQAKGTQANLAKKLQQQAASQKHTVHQNLLHHHAAAHTIRDPAADTGSFRRDSERGKLKQSAEVVVPHHADERSSHLGSRSESAMPPLVDLRDGGPRPIKNPKMVLAEQVYSRVASVTSLVSESQQATHDKLWYYVGSRQDPGAPAGGPMAAVALNDTNGSNVTLPPPPAPAPTPAPPPPPPKIPRRLGPYQDDPRSNVTGCEPYPCELEEHYRPPIYPPPPVPLPRCGFHGSRELKLAWNANVNWTMNLSYSLGTTVRVQVGFDPLYQKPKQKVFQPSFLMNVTNGMSEVHDCREVNAGYLGYFTVSCRRSVANDTDSFTDEAFHVEWGVGKLKVDNATWDDSTGSWLPGGCIPDTWAPKLESIEMGTFTDKPKAGIMMSDDSLFILYGIETNRLNGLGTGQFFPTMLPTLWLKWRCETCTVPNPAYWEELFALPPPIVNLTVNCTNGTYGTINQSNWTVCTDGANGTNGTGTLTQITSTTTTTTGPPPYPALGWLNISTLPEKPDQSKRILMKPLPAGLPEGTQVVEATDTILLRFDECVTATNEMITWMPLNPPPLYAEGLKPRGYKKTAFAMSARASDVFRVTVWCGNVTITPPSNLMTQNRGQMYEINIPDGAFQDYAEVPNKSPGMKWNVTVRDTITPHVIQHWDQAFYPKQGHEGRYPWHNITIRFDEEMMLNPFKEPVITLDPRGTGGSVIDVNLADPEQAQLLEQGFVLHVNPFGNAKDSFTGDPVGFALGATYHAVIGDHILQDLFGNAFTGLSSCKGPITYTGHLNEVDCSVIAPEYPYEPCSCTGAYHFKIATTEQMEMRKKIGFLLKWTRRRMNDTLAMYSLPTSQDEYTIDGSPLPGTFKQASAGGQAFELMFYQGHAQKMLDEPDGIYPMWDLTKIFNRLTDHRIEPEGYSWKEPFVCGHFASHAIPSVNFKCSYTADKRMTGFDVWNNAPTFFFREGCHCTIDWQGGCPYQLNQWPSYKDFGLAMVEEKKINNNMASNGFTHNSLCWYWTDPLFPWKGYLGHPDNKVWVPDTTQQFYCKWPRIPDQPCSTLRLWEWDIGPTRRQAWSKPSAYHPTEQLP